MYEHLDGILTCRDLVPAGCAGSEAPGYFYIGPQSALGTSTWAFCTSTSAPGRSQAPRSGPGRPRRPRSILDPPRAGFAPSGG